MMILIGSYGIPTVVYLGVLAVLGGIVGSFAAVTVYRIPRGISIVIPRSHCIHCGAELRWYELFPVLSWFLQLGRCRSCRSVIGLEPLLIELFEGGLLVLVGWYAPSWYSFVHTALFLTLLFIISIIDFQHKIIPDQLSLGGVAMGVVLTFLAQASLSTYDSIAGAVFGYGLFWFVAWIYERVRGREGLGGGDGKLLAMIGAFLGWQSIVPVVILSSLVGTVIGVGLAIRSGQPLSKLVLPYAPFLSIAAFLYRVVGNQLVQQYLDFVGW